MTCQCFDLRSPFSPCRQLQLHKLNYSTPLKGTRTIDLARLVSVVRCESLTQYLLGVIWLLAMKVLTVQLCWRSLDVSNLDKCQHKYDEVKDETYFWLILLARRVMCKIENRNHACEDAAD
jgi:hypothetical protein